MRRDLPAHSYFNFPSFFCLQVPEGSPFELLVTGANLVDSAALACRVGPDLSSSSARWLAPTQVLCAFPSMSLAATTAAQVYVTNNGVEFSSDDGGVTVAVVGRTSTFAVSPNHGSTAGGTPVRIMTRRFPSSGTAYCRFDGSLTVPATVADRLVRCVTPPHGPASVTLELSTDGAFWMTLDTPFEFAPPPTVSGMDPAFGGVNGGTAIGVTGTGLGRVALCQVGGVAASIVAANETRMVCLSPRRLEAGHASVRVSTNGADFVRGGLAFVYVPTPRITALWPPSGPERGGTVLSLMGVHMMQAGGLACRFGGSTAAAASIVAASWISNNTVKCVTPAAMPGGTTVALSLNGADFYESEVDFTFHESIGVSHVSPTWGAVSGGTAVRLVATNVAFSPHLTCRFGTKDVPGTLINGSEVLCVTPSHRAGSVQVSLSLNGVDFDEAATAFTFLAAPAVTGASPAAGWSSGGALVTLNVSSLPGGGDLACVFGAKEVPAVRVPGSTASVTCEAPPVSMASDAAPVLRVALRLALPSSSLNAAPVTLATGQATFTYQRPFVVIKLTPGTGSVLGGTWVTVAGENFVNSMDLRCTFGEKDETFAHFVSPTEVRCRTPAHLPGRVTVGVAAGGLRALRTQVDFEFLPPVSLVSASPLESPHLGGTTVVLRGTGFTDSALLVCRFGSTVTPATLVSPQEVACTTPARAPGPVTLSVATNGADFATLPSNFTYHLASTVTGVHPTWGPPGTVVQVAGTGFKNSSHLECLFGTRAVPGSLLSPQVVQCVAPPLDAEASVGGHASTVRVEIRDGEAVTTSGHAFEVVASPVVLAVFPTHGPMGGGTQVAVTGLNFENSEGLHCRFGAEVSRAVFVSTSRVECMSPAVAGYAPESQGVPSLGSEVALNVAAHNTSFESAFQLPSAVTFRYEPAMVVTDVSPKTVSTRGAPSWW